MTQGGEIDGKEVSNKIITESIKGVKFQDE